MYTATSYSTIASSTSLRLASIADFQMDAISSGYSTEQTKVLKPKISRKSHFSKLTSSDNNITSELTHDKLDPTINSSYNSNNNFSAQVNHSKSTNIKSSSETYKYLLKTQPSYQSKDYVNKQQAITAGMRSILIDWLIEISCAHHFTPNKFCGQPEAWLESEVLPLTVNFIDRFLNKYKLSKTKFQLLGIVALSIALKITSDKLPGIDELTSLTAETYNEFQIQKLEQIILQELDFKLLPPLTQNFYTHYLINTGAGEDNDLPTTKQYRTYSALFCQFLCEMALLDYGLTIFYEPAEVAIAVVVLLRTCLNILLLKPKNNKHLFLQIDKTEPSLLENIRDKGVVSEKIGGFIEDTGGDEPVNKIEDVVNGLVKLWKGILRQKPNPEKESITAILFKYTTTPSSFTSKFPSFKFLAMNPPREEQIKQVFDDWRYDRSRTSGSIKYSFEV